MKASNVKRILMERATGEYKKYNSLKGNLENGIFADGSKKSDYYS